MCCRCKGSLFKKPAPKTQWKPEAFKQKGKTPWKSEAFKQKGEKTKIGFHSQLIRQLSQTDGNQDWLPQRILCKRQSIRNSDLLKETIDAANLEG